MIFLVQHSSSCGHVGILVMRIDISTPSTVKGVFCTCIRRARVTMFDDTRAEQDMWSDRAACMLRRMHREDENPSIDEEGDV